MRSKVSLIIIIFCFCLGISCGYCQQDNNRFWRWAQEDPIDMFSNIGPRQIAMASSVGMGIVAISLNDSNISYGLQQHYHQSQVLNVANLFGNGQIVLPVSAGIFGTSLLTNNAKFQDAAFTSLQTLVMTKMVVGAGKFLMARKRPYQNAGPYNVQLAELGATSFPSGHTATAFALITPWVVYYPNVFTYSLMAVPVGTAIARVAKGRHWLSDVTAGAAIGFSMGYYLAKKHLNLQSKRVQITPSAGLNSLSLSVNLSF